MNVILLLQAKLIMILMKKIKFLRRKMKIHLMILLKLYQKKKIIVISVYKIEKKEKKRIQQKNKNQINTKIIHHNRFSYIINTQEKRQKEKKNITYFLTDFLKRRPRL